MFHKYRLSRLSELVGNLWKIINLPKSANLRFVNFGRFWQVVVWRGKSLELWLDNDSFHALVRTLTPIRRGGFSFRSQGPTLLVLALGRARRDPKEPRRGARYTYGGYATKHIMHKQWLFMREHSRELSIHPYATLRVAHTNDWVRRASPLLCGYLWTCLRCAAFTVFLRTGRYPISVYFVDDYDKARLFHATS